MNALPSTSSNPPSTCLICTKPANGNHFGVECCRACAAFFRRTVVTHQQNYECVKRTDNCEHDEAGRWRCKSCRKKRCLDIGMSADNIRYNCDKLSIPISSFPTDILSIPRHLSTDPIQIHLRQKGHCYVNAKYFDVSVICREMDYMMGKTPKLHKTKQGMSQLEHLAIGLKEIRKSQSWESLADIGTVDQNVTWSTWISDTRRTGIFLMYFEEFRNLDSDIKLEIFKCMWHLFSKLERMAITAEMRIRKVCGEQEVVFNSHHKLNYGKLALEPEWFSNGTESQVKDTFGSLPTWFCEPVISGLMDLKPTDEELSFMLCNLCFEATGKRYGGKVQEATDLLQFVLANDLHQYYLKQDKLSRYSHRLMKMLSLNRLYMSLRADRKEKMLLAHVTNVIRVHISHPDLFQFAI